MITRRLAVVTALTAGLVVAGVAASVPAATWSPAVRADDPLGAQAIADKAHLEAEEQAAAAERARVAADPDLQRAAVDFKLRAAAAHDAVVAAQAVDGQADDASNAWPTGIFEDPEAPASGGDFLGSNRWVGLVGDTTVAVYAGVSGTDATTGRLLIAVDGPTITGARIDLAGSGALRVASADGAVLSITDVSGHTHLFDVATRTWQS